MSKEAIRLALGTLEAIANHGDIAAIATPDGVIFLETAITALREALAEQPARQQEPVGEVFINTGSGALFAPMKDVRWKDGKMPPEGAKLYTSPPAQRKPLTDEELRNVLRNTNHMIRNAMHGPFWPELEQACRAIEAAHGIKGDA